MVHNSFALLQFSSSRFSCMEATCQLPRYIRSLCKKLLTRLQLLNLVCLVGNSKIHANEMCGKVSFLLAFKTHAVRYIYFLREKINAKRYENKLVEWQKVLSWYKHANTKNTPQRKWRSTNLRVEITTDTLVFAHAEHPHSVHLLITFQ